MSRFLLVRDAAASLDARDALVLCRAALQVNADNHDADDADDISSLCIDASSAVRNAVAVTLEVLESEHAPLKRQTRTWLADYEYRQVLVETLQHHLLLCRGAVVQLPRPSGLVDPHAAVLEFKVVSVYPDADFVCVTANTRVTLTTAGDERVDSADGVDAAVVAVHSVESDADHSTLSEQTSAPKIGGLEKEQAALRDMILLPVENAELGERCGIEFPKGLLLCGPPGVGKTLLVCAVVHQCRKRVPLQLKIINGAEIMTSGVGDAETALRRIFQDAASFARRTRGAAVIFIDELDALCPKRDASSATAHSRVVAQLLTLLDGVDKQARDNVIIVGATNLPNAIDPALRRPGRFDRELFVAPPGATERSKIFQMNMREMPICCTCSEGATDATATAAAKAAFVDELARKSIGYVGADIAALCREALAIATTRQFVAMAKDKELSAWWREWQRHSKPLYNANFSAVVAGNAWSANPVAIPLWFLSKVKHQPQPQPRGEQRRNERGFFSFLLRGVSTSAEEAVDTVSDTDSLRYTLPIAQSVIGDADSDPASVAFEVTMADFEQAMQVVVASSLRGAAGFSKDFERLGWDSIGGQEHTKLALQQALEWPIKYPQTFARLGVKPPRGILLYGPPGCSKSTIVRAAAHASGATFLTLSAAQVFSPFFGDAEASVRQVFRDARAALPAIVFFDEIDVLVAKRHFGGSGGGDAGSSSAMRVMSTMLNEMDGVESADGLLVIGATNRPDCIDAALLRPGRFDRILYVDLPTERDRLTILQIHSAPMQLADDVDLAAMAARTPFFSGAELENVCREAALHALRESISAECVRMRHFEEALATAAPGSSPASLRQYREFADKMGRLA